MSGPASTWARSISLGYASELLFRKKVVRIHPCPSHGYTLYTLQASQLKQLLQQEQHHDASSTLHAQVRKAFSRERC